MSLLSKVKPTPQPVPLDAFFAAGHQFFCRRLAIPSEVDSGDEGDFVLLELERMSPFPLEHLYYGYVVDRARRYAFVFAAYRRRFDPSQTNGWRRMECVLPDFMVALGLERGDGQSLALVTERSLLLFAFDAESELPSSVFAESRQAEEGEFSMSRLESQVAEFCLRAPERMRGRSARRWIANREGRWLGQDAWFGAETLSGEPAAKVSFRREALWRSDLRDPDMIEKARREERQNTVLWRGLLGVAATICLLLLGEAIWGGTLGFLAFQKSQNADRAPLVRTIDSLQSLSSKLSDFKYSNVEPFRMIESLLPYQQWPDIVYKKFETSGPDTLVLEARADNQLKLNEFKKRLERYEKVQSVEISNWNLRPTDASASVTIKFIPNAFSANLEMARNE